MAMGGSVGLHNESPWRATVSEELERVCASDAFSHSKQSARLLRYLVEHSLEANEDQLRERAIGANLFGREPKYDTNEDSIVRVSATEVRKRLARYYREAGARGPIQLSIPLGSYRVEFVTTAATNEPETPEVLPPVTRRRWPPAVAAGAVVPALALVGLYLFWPATSIERFWGPALRDPARVIILAPHPIVYTFSRETFQRFRGDSSTHAQRQIEVLTGPPEATIQLKDVVPITDQYLGLGSAHAISDVSALLAVRKKEYSLRFGEHFSFQEIRDAPAVLVGAYANRWTLQLTDDARFVLSDRNGAPEIADRQTGKVWALKDLRLNGRTPEDFVIVSRLFHPKTGRLVLALAGITQYGTQAAGEFVTSEELLSAATRSAPAGWERKNVQFVLHMAVVEGVPSRPQVVASHYW